MKPQVPIEVDATSGVWTTDGLPMLYVPRHFFVNNHTAIESALGREKYAALLYDAGYKSAYFWCASESGTHALQGLAVFEHYLKRLSQRGWGQFSFQTVDARAGLADIRLDNSMFVLASHRTAGACATCLQDGSRVRWTGCRSRAHSLSRLFPVRLNALAKVIPTACSRSVPTRHHCPIDLARPIFMRYPHLFSPFTLNKVTLRNRVVSTAHAEVYAEEGGLPGERYIRYYEEKAKGGLALAICGGSSPVSLDSPQGWWRSVNLTTDEIIGPLGRLAEAMHRHGAKIMIQATHMGRRSSYYGERWPHLVSPSGIREPVHRGNAKIIEKHEIRRIITDFAAAARRVQAAGMDGIEISAAHQHLIDQFWSLRTNHRSDEYGGSLQNRLRFGVEVLTAVRDAVGKDFCVGLRMCGDEFHEDGLDHESLKEIAQAMSTTGLIDYLSVIGSGADTHNTLANCMPPMALPPEPFVHLAAGIKSVSKVPVMHAQSIRDATQAERILAQGWVDLVGMTRAQIADPYLLAKIRDGQEDRIRQCVGANYCIDRQYLGQDVLCIQNAATSREQTMPHIITKTPGPVRKVVVVGAGPAGLEAARVARERGHQVVLFERDPARVDR